MWGSGSTLRMRYVSLSLNVAEVTQLLSLAAAATQSGSFRFDFSFNFSSRAIPEASGRVSGRVESSHVLSHSPALNRRRARISIAVALLLLQKVGSANCARIPHQKLTTGPPQSVLLSSVCALVFKALTWPRRKIFMNEPERRSGSG